MRHYITITVTQRLFERVVPFVRVLRDNLGLSLGQACQVALNHNAITVPYEVLGKILELVPDCPLQITDDAGTTIYNP